MGEWQAHLVVRGLGVSLAALTLADVWLERHTGVPVGIPMSADATKPDLLFCYGLADVQALFDGYGAGGRRAYAVGLVVDTAYPLALAAATILVSARAFGTRVRWLWLAPVMFAVLDVVENVGLGIALVTYPAVSEGLIRVLSPITQVKLVSFPFTVVLLVAAAATLGHRWWRGRRALR